MSLIPVLLNKRIMIKSKSLVVLGRRSLSTTQGKQGLDWMEEKKRILGEEQN